MKNLTNILSYLWLLLLMAVTACSDLEEEVGPMQGEEEVELNIQTEVSGMKGSTRAQMEITEEISTIVAIAFDGSGALIKKVDATLTPTNDYQGTLKIKVPKRTQTIHFLGNYTKNDIEKSITSLETLNSFTTNDVTTMRYWGRADYNGGNDLSVILYRNMAKLTLKKGEGFTANSCYIAGFVNRNLSGTIVPSEYAVGDTPTIPDSVGTGTYGADNSLGNVYYLFEHANVENNNPLYVILEIAAKYYKVAFAAGDTYFPIIRNHEYTITIDGIDAMYAENNYTYAVNSQYPINDLVITSVPMTVTASPTEVLNQSGQTFTVTVTIPEGITELNVPTHDAFTITPPNGLTEQNGKYAVTPGSNYAFTFTVKDGVEAGDKNLSFSGRGKYKRAEGSVTVTLEQPAADAIKAVPVAYSLNYTTDESSVSDLLVNVTIPNGVTTLTFASDYFDAMVVGQALALTDDAYTITHGENAESTTIPVRLRLKQDKKADTNASFTFGSKDANVESAVINNIDLNPINDENVRWQGNVPLNWNNYATIVPLMYDWFLDGINFIPVGSKLNLEFTVTGGNGSTLQVFEICGDTEDDWNDPVHQFAELNNSNTYTATGDGNNTLSLTLSEATFNTISENFRNDFLGETGDEKKIAMAIRGTGITLTKVSIVPVEVTPTSNILVTAPGATEGVSNASVDISYSNPKAIEEYTITVTVPDGVTQLNYSNNGFSNVYIDNNGWYNDAQSPINISDTKSIPLRLRVNKDYNSNPTITFSANNVESATFTVNRTEGSTDSNVLWEGALLFQGYNVHVSKIDIHNDLLQGKVFDGAVLTVEYEVINDNDDFLSIYGSGISNWANIGGMATDYTDNNTSTITMTLNSTIIENIGNGSINMQGDGRVLKKVTLTPPADVQFKVLEETISLDLATNETVLYVQKPANINQLTITDNENLFGTVSTTFANANVNGKTINNLPNDAATIPIKLEITRVVDIKNYTITVATNDGRSDNVTINLLSTWSGSHSLGNWEGFWGSARKLPVGSTVQITFADYNNCSFELHTYNSSTNFGYDIRLRDFSTTADGEDYISTSHLTNGVFTFTVATDGSVMIRNNGNLNNVTDAGLDGLQINGGNGLSVTQVSVTLGGGETPEPTEPLINIDFSGANPVYGWYTTHQGNIVTKGEIIVVDGTLRLTNEHVNTTNGVQASLSQAAIDVTFENNVAYTLTFRIRADVNVVDNNDGLSNEIPIAFQDDIEGSWPSCGDFKTSESKNAQLNTEWTTVTLTAIAERTPQKGRIIFSFGHLVGSIYIDDIKLVKN